MKKNKKKLRDAEDSSKLSQLFLSLSLKKTLRPYYQEAFNSKSCTDIRFLKSGSKYFTHTERKENNHYKHTRKSQNSVKLDSVHVLASSLLGEAKDSRIGRWLCIAGNFRGRTHGQPTRVPWMHLTFHLELNFLLGQDHPRFHRLDPI